MKKCVFFQLANVAAYPPGLNAIEMFVESGYEVKVICLDPVSTNNVDYPEGFNKTLLHLISSGHTHWFFAYVRLFLTVIRELGPRANEETIVYGFDELSCPILNFCGKLGIVTVYHEHDSPGIEFKESNPFKIWLGRQREKTLRVADELVFPNLTRYELWCEALNIPPRNVRLIQNSPLTRNWKAQRQLSRSDEEILLHYHGNISSRFLPLVWLEVLQSLPPHYKLSVVGYEAQKSQGYMADFLRQAESLNLKERVHYFGVMTREELFSHIEKCNIGISVMKYDNDQNFNEMNLFPASNKVWDYLSAGMSLIIDQEKEDEFPLNLRRALVSCDSSSVPSIVAGILSSSQWELTQMIVREYSFETAFRDLISNLAVLTRHKKSS